MPKILIAVYSDDAAFSQRWQQELGLQITEEHPDSEIEVHTGNDEAALDDLLDEAGLQAVVLHTPRMSEFVARCRQRRPHANLFVILPQSQRDQIDELLGEPA